MALLFPKFGGLERASRMKYFLLALLLYVGLSTHCQVENPIKWSTDVKELGRNEYSIIFTAVLDDGWHLYSQNLPDDDGPIATFFDFKSSGGYELVGKTSEPKPLKEFDPNFQMELLFFEHEATFEQKVRITQDVTITGEYSYMVCDASKCLPPDYVPFSFDLKYSGSGDEPAEPIAEMDDGNYAIAGELKVVDPASFSADISNDGNGKYTVNVTADIEEGWHIYSLNLPEDDVPYPTQINLLPESENIEPLGPATTDSEEIRKKDPQFDNKELAWYEGIVVLSRSFVAYDGAQELKGEVYYMACNDEMCTAPMAYEFAFPVPETASEKLETADVSNNAVSEDDSFISLFVKGFLAGLAALLTPCVFPMIPLTVSFFTKQSGTRAKGISNATIYGLSIVAIYTGLGVIITAAIGKDALHALSTGAPFNLFLFALLVIFAISFFGAFEITLPSSLSTKLDAASDKGGLIGIFFMATTLSVVSFSCTGPVIGSVVAVSGIGGMSQVMFGFSVALALPFTLFAIFPGWLNSLPQSGGWLNTVKVVLGFVELAFAFKFLSNADLVEQWHLLHREVFIAIWAGIFLALTLYLFGVYKMPHDSPLDRLSVGRAMTGMTALIFTLYLIPGLWGAPLKLISGFPPPDYYADSPGGLFAAANNGGGVEGDKTEKYVADAHCPQGLNCVNDLDQAKELSKKTGKPIMIDFTGYACVNCRRMEDNVWTDKRVWNRLNDEFIIASLYVDEREELDESEHFYSEVLEKTVTEKGQKWVDYEIKEYGANTQPLYVITDSEGKRLIETASYDPDIEKFIQWLDKGKASFNGPNS